MSASARTVPHITLRDDVVIPQLGYGVWQVPADTTAELVQTAFETGYRHIDTAKAYENEAEVGEAFRSSRLSRDEVFITTKLWNGDQGFDSAKEALKASLERLRLDF